eukprot:gnl/TRDRNA2_/TRDRNA2_186627_c0_seq1.p1 gnl/TRDRNA2_/TRDRNA2_186627_c0~~gnl/TRDRNA2_/TRDRNA2_186627_c0_seq1.p1  ORF type:complete len:364 (-),score=39.43 gnl/TRDRNA2_/TRDRNA2_186627_c0_seq1:168-1223(-)
MAHLFRYRTLLGAWILALPLCDSLSASARSRARSFRLGNIFSGSSGTSGAPGSQQDPPIKAAVRGEQAFDGDIRMRQGRVVERHAGEVIPVPTIVHVPLPMGFDELTTLLCGCIGLLLVIMFLSIAVMIIAQKRAQQPRSPRPDKRSDFGGSDATKSIADFPCSEPLCPIFVVPEGTRLTCNVQDQVCRKRQEFDFTVTGRAGAPLFDVCVSELKSNPRISLFSRLSITRLNGTEEQVTVAYVSTEELWHATGHFEQPIFTLYRTSGAIFATIQKDKLGNYVVLREGSTYFRFSGSFLNHSLQGWNEHGHLVVFTSQTAMESYQVQVEAGVDAGMVVLCLMAIDKCERRSM